MLSFSNIRSFFVGNHNLAIDDTIHPRMPKYYKMKPIVELLTGKLKENHQNWIGVTLTARVVAAIASLALYQEINLLLTITGTFCLALIVSQADKENAAYLSALEIVFMLNLVVVSAYFLGSDTKYRAVFTTVSIAISILLFLGVFVYHAVELVGKVCSTILKFRVERQTKKNVVKNDDADEQLEEWLNRPTTTTVDVDIETL